MKLTLGFSPCPNDTFIFDALVNKKIDTANMQFEVVLEDVQTLNEWALQGKLDVSKISYGVLPLLLKEYIVLSSGGALGTGVGPLLIAKSEIRNPKSEIINMPVAIPGKHTTAHMLFSLAFPEAKNKIFKKFNEIEDTVLRKEAGAGVIIHENRFTYHLKGLHKIMDLGEFWQKKTGLPVPLGGIVAKKSLDKSVVNKVDELIRESVRYSYKYHHQVLSEYVTQHAQEMSENVMRLHIDLYVNNYTININENGKKAVFQLLEIYQQLHPEYSFDKSSLFA